jgi:polyisoprenoid-binding protein YceI
MVQAYRCIDCRHGSKGRRALRRVLLAALPIGSLLNPAAASETIKLEKENLSIKFDVAGFWPLRVAGRFNEAHGLLTLDTKSPAQSSLKVVVRTASIDTGSERIDRYLKSTDFFDVARHPVMIFESTGLEIVDQDAGTISGDLSLRGVRKPMRLSFRVRRPQSAKPAAAPLMNFRARGVLQRSRWGMTALFPAVGDQVHLEIRADVADAKRRPKADAAGEALPWK